MSELPAYSFLSCGDSTLKKLTCTCVLDPSQRLFAAGSYYGIIALCQVLEDGRVGIVDGAKVHRDERPLYSVGADSAVIGSKIDLQNITITPVEQYDLGQANRSSVCINGSDLLVGDWSGFITHFSAGQATSHSINKVSDYQVNDIVALTPSTYVAALSDGRVLYCGVEHGIFTIIGYLKISDLPLRAITVCHNRIFVSCNDGIIYEVGHSAASPATVFAHALASKGKALLLDLSSDDETGTLVLSGDQPYATAYTVGAPVPRPIAAAFPLPDTPWASVCLPWTNGARCTVFVSEDGWMHVFALTPATPAPPLVDQHGTVTYDDYVALWRSRMEQSMHDPCALFDEVPTNLMANPVPSPRMPEAAVVACQPVAGQDTNTVLGNLWVFARACGGWVRVGGLKKPAQQQAGQAGPTGQLGKKTAPDGSQWDYVIPVEMEQGGRGAPLCMNRGENPWTVAERYLLQNHMDQQMQQEIVEFIQANITRTRVAPPPPTHSPQPAYHPASPPLTPTAAPQPSPLGKPQTDPAQRQQSIKAMEFLAAVPGPHQVDTAVVLRALRDPRCAALDPPAAAALSRLLVNYAGEGGARLFTVLRYFVAPIPALLVEIVTAAGGLAALCRRRVPDTAPKSSALLVFTLQTAFTSTGSSVCQRLLDDVTDQLELGRVLSLAISLDNAEVTAAVVMVARAVCAFQNRIAGMIIYLFFARSRGLALPSLVNTLVDAFVKSMLRLPDEAKMQISAAVRGTQLEDIVDKLFRGYTK